MASIFGMTIGSVGNFRTRSPDRDNAVDKERLARLTALMDQIASEIEAERTGLEARYRREVQDAGFLVDDMENQELSQRASSRAGELTHSILRCEKRLTILARQSALLAELRNRTEGEWSLTPGTGAPP